MGAINSKIRTVIWKKGSNKKAQANLLGLLVYII